MRRVAVMGASGRMGQEVIRILESHSELEFAAGVAKDTKVYLSQASQLSASDVDAVIDFSLPDGFVEIVNWCVENKKPLVSGTTGITDNQLDLLKTASKEIPVLWSPNMSLGIAVLRKALSVFTEANWFDFAIEEFHHNKKVDRPSGTALHLQKALEHKIGREVSEVSAVRGGGIYGVHSVFCDVRRRSFRVQAHSPQSFRVCLWSGEELPMATGPKARHVHPGRCDQCQRIMKLSHSPPTLL
jgi:4-hydroxy-tetrahydrodipicolinate reductase